MREATVTFESLAFGGDAVGRLDDGKVVFVPLAAPGDRAVIRIIQERKSFCRGELVRVVDPGQGRRDPPCSLFGACGGCQWQHVRYPVQLAAKQAILHRAVPAADPLEGTAGELAYRRRARLHWRCTTAGVILGFMQRGSRQVLDLEQCPLLTPALETALEPLRRSLALFRRGRGTASMLAGEGSSVHLSVRLEHKPAGSVRRLLAALEQSFVGGEVTFRDGGRRTFGVGSVDVSTTGSSLLASASTFVQANAVQNRRLGELVGRCIPPEARRILELFAGIGNLTRHLTDDDHPDRMITAVESSGQSSAFLARNTKRLPGTVKVVNSTAAAALGKLASSGERYDLVLLDPPRQGCDPDLIKRLVAGAPLQVLYVSCDPATLQRDISMLNDKGFDLLSATGLDMMPQTFHLEAVALLGKSAP